MKNAAAKSPNKKLAAPSTLIEGIAKEHFDIETLVTRRRDSLDFYDIAVWQIKAGLEAAYLVGVESNSRAKVKGIKQG